MFTDLVGFTTLTQADEAGALRLLARHQALLRPLFAQFGGREVKTAGDSFLVEFASALDAMRCALAIQERLAAHNAAPPAEGAIRVRIGLHIGDVVRDGADVLGDAVNIASRIEPLAEPGGICLSQQVFDQVVNKIDAALVALPAQMLKNVQLPIAVYRVGATPTVRPPAYPPASGPSEAPGGGVRPADGGHHLAVLPLSNISPDPHDEYVADGLTEELISVLSQVPGLRVIARTSVAQYKTQPKPIPEIGRELGVDAVIEGSVRKAGNRLRITLQLVDVPTQRHIWANSYNREIDDVFAVQTEIAERTAEALRVELARRGLPPPDRRPTPNPAAYDLYLRGLVAAADIAGGGLEPAVQCFEQATALDPTFAEAFAAWANLYVAVAGESVPMRAVMPRARELAARALALDPESSDAHAALANLTFQCDHDWARAEGEFRRALALNPSNVGALQFYALMLIALGRFDEAKQLQRQAIRLDPAGHHLMGLALAHLYAGEYAEALELMRREVEAEPDRTNTHLGYGMFALGAGRREEAAREAARPLRDPSENDRYDHALLTALLGRPEEARAVLAQAERGELQTYTSATHCAILWAAIGEDPAALDLLEAELRDGDPVLWLFYRGIWFDRLRTHPRFLALLRAYGLPDPGPRPSSQFLGSGP